ncbi:MAG: NERD domain-containing protein, partial [Actinobacteria bacterium]|nr:NERD domain-containing protein [Actinomycetota bacterium]
VVEPTAPEAEAAEQDPEQEGAGVVVDDDPLPEQASLHHDLDPSTAVPVAEAAGDGATDLFAPAPIAVPVPNGDRPVDLMAPPRPAPGSAIHLVPADLLDRGDMGEGRVGQTLEGARVHGLEVVHGLRVEPGMHPIGHLVVAVNGLWVVDAVDVLAGKLERRDEGDWFTADPRLHIGGQDHTALVAAVREKVEAVNRLLARTDFTDIPVRGVLCFGSVQPGWITEPFVLDGVAITWRRKLVEPMLDPVLVDQQSRSALLNLLVDARVDARPATPAAVDEEREVS